MLARVIQEIQTVLKTSQTTPMDVCSKVASSRAAIMTIENDDEKLAKLTLIQGNVRALGHCLREVLTLMVLGPSNMAVKIYGVSIDSVTWNGQKLVAFKFSMKRMNGHLDLRSQELLNDQSRCVRLLFESALALYFLHSLHLHHRDVKEQNFLVDGDDHVHVSDLESTRFRETGTVLNSENWGTRYYAAPEVTFGRYGFPADVYSLGRVFDSVSRGRKSQYPKIKSLSEKMLVSNPEQRPSIRDVVRYFLEEVPDVPDEEREDVCRKMRERFDYVKQTLLEYQECVFASHFDLAPASWSEYLMRLADPNVDGEYPLQFGRIFDRDDAMILRFFKDKDTHESLALQEKIATEGSSYAKGCHALAHGKVAEAVAIFHDGAKNECLLCLTELGIVLYDFANKEKGLKLLKIAAQKGSVKAMSRLAMYCWSQPEQRADSMFWLQQAASLGHEASAWALSHFIPLFS